MGADDRLERIEKKVDRVLFAINHGVKVISRETVAKHTFTGCPAEKKAVVESEDFEGEEFSRKF